MVQDLLSVKAKYNLNFCYEKIEKSIAKKHNSMEIIEKYQFTETAPGAWKNSSQL